MIIKCIKSINFETINGMELEMPCRLDINDLFIVSNVGGFHTPCILFKEKYCPEGYEQIVTCKDFRLLLKYNYIKIEE